MTINRIKTWKSLFCFTLCAAGLGPAAQAGQQPTPPPPPPPGGIGQASDALAAQALDDINHGKLDDAAKAYTSLIQLYPNSGDVPEAMFRLGYVQYVQGNYDQAVATLKGIAAPPAPAEIKTAADALIPQILAAKASKMPQGDPARKAAYQDALDQFDAFIKAHANEPAAETAQYGRAVASFQNQDFDGAEQSLEKNLKQFPNSESLLDSEDLLAVVLTAQAGSILQAHGDHDAAMAKFNEALSHLSNIIRLHTDVALANDAQFQAGEVLFNRGNAEQGPARLKDLRSAISVYREVLPKDQMLLAQQARVAADAARLRQAAINGDQAGKLRAQQLLDLDNTKLDSLKTGPDETMNAQLRIASCYYLLQQYDEARVLLKFLQPFAETDDQKKQIDYYLVLSYASQGITDKAEAAYNDFQAKFKGDPLGENLPLAMGAMFLSAKNSQPDKATTYLDQEGTLYPSSNLVNQALGEEAAAYIGLHRYDEALAAYQKFLATNPPADQAAQAQFGMANIYQATGKIPDAIAQYQKLATTYPGTAQAEQSAFYAPALEAGVDPKKALADLQAFVAKFPASQFTPRAMMMIAQLQASTGDAASAMKTYADVAAKFPQSEFVPQSFFQRAAILAKAGKNDEMVALLKDFLKACPDNKDIFYAYDTIGQTEATKGDLPAAVATYSEMAANHPDNPMAPTALLRIADLWHKQADTLGRYIALSEDQRKEWSKDIASSLAAGEKLLEQFPGSDQAGQALKTLLADQEMLLDAQLKSDQDVANYFRTLSGRYSANPSAKSRILFTLAIFDYRTQPAKALPEMAAAYDPSLVYAPEDLDLYGSALIDQGKPDQAYKIYAKIAADYPTPPGIQPAQAPASIQEAQATALFGMGSALSKQGKTDDAGKLFAQLKTLYPWSPKVVEANFGIARALVANNQLDDALKLLAPIVGSHNGSASLRAQALLLTGDIWMQKGNVDAAIDCYLKTADFYGGVPGAASEALWKGGQALEKQAAGLTEQSTPKKSEQIAKAVDSYKEIVSTYHDSQFTQQAQDRLSALGAK